MRRLDVCALAELPPGSARVVRDGLLAIGAYIAGELFALDDHCSHDGGALAEGELDA